MMNRFLVAILLLFGVYGQIISLSDNNHEILQNSELSLIYFGKENCKYCEEFGPIFDQLGDYYDNDDHFQILKVDATANVITKMNFGIKSYPTVYLYRHESKKVKKFKEKRNLLSLVNFINDNTNAINKELESNIQVVKTLDDLTLTQELVVFTLSNAKTWEEFEFPSHFMQQKSYEYNYKFSIVLVDQLPDNSLLQKFKIANYPSVMYFTSPEKFKIFKTLSDNHVYSDKLTEEDFVAFLDHLNGDEQQYGWWFTPTELEDFVNYQKYQFVEDTHMGFNFRQARVDEDEDEEADYIQMVNGVRI